MKSFIKIVILCLCITSVQADTIKMHPFQLGSYQQIMEHQKHHPFILIIWSITCSACLAEMELIHKIQQQAKIKLIMLSVDGPEFHDEMRHIIKQNQLEQTEHWFFTEDNSRALRYQIDSHWYGELPRTYFYDNKHQRKAISGVIKPAEYQTYIDKITS